jgi:hypothetical protein
MPLRKATLAGRSLEPSRHVCAFFHTKEEEYRVLRSFVREGLDAGEKAYHIVETGRQREHVKCLHDHGIDKAEQAHSKGQLEVRAWEDAYLRDGHFDQDRMIALIQSVLRQGRDEGYPMTRLVANMEWGLLDRPGVNDIVEYESRLNHVLPQFEDPVICTYDLTKFSASVVMDMLRTHPMVIVGGLLQQNPLYVPPDEFLVELRDRRKELAAA